MPVRGAHRQRHRTPLLDWLEAKGWRNWDLAKAIGCGPAAVEYWKWNQVIPDLIHARKIELVTGGGVPMLSWLSTPYGKQRYDKVANWAKIASEGWSEHNEARKSKKLKDPEDAA